MQLFLFVVHGRVHLLHRKSSLFANKFLSSPLAALPPPSSICSRRACSSKEIVSPQRSPKPGDDGETTKRDVAFLKQVEHLFGRPLTEQWTEEELKQKEQAIKEDKWTAVYRNGGLAKFFLVLRLNTVLMVVICGMFFYRVGASLADNEGMLELVDFWRELVLLIFALITSRLIKKYFTRVVGVVAVDTRTRSIFRIGLFTPTGGRQNEFARPGDFLTIPESNEMRFKKYAKFRWTFRSSEECLFLDMRQYELVDKRAAYQFFGNLKYFEGMEKRGIPVEVLAEDGATKGIGGGDGGGGLLKEPSKSTTRTTIASAAAVERSDEEGKIKMTTDAAPKFGPKSD